jgi:hypothetical protein
MSKFTDKDYERANAEAFEAVDRYLKTRLPEFVEVTEYRFYGASFSAGDDIPSMKAFWCSPASSLS